MKAHPETRIGHVHLKVTDLDRSIAFYRDVIGLDVTQRYGVQAAFLSAGGYHHHIGLNTWHSLNGPRPDPRAPGLYHTAFLYPDRKALAAALQLALDNGVELEGRRRPRRVRGPVFLGPRRQRHRVVPRPRSGGLAAQRRRRPRHVEPPAGPEGAAGRACLTLEGGAGARAAHPIQPA